MDNKKILEEIDIIVRASVEDARKDFKKIQDETVKTVDNINKNFKGLDTAKKQVSNVIESSKDKIEELQGKIAFLSKQKLLSEYQTQQLEKYKQQLAEINDMKVEPDITIDDVPIYYHNANLDDVKEEAENKIEKVDPRIGTFGKGFLTDLEEPENKISELQERVNDFDMYPLREEIKTIGMQIKDLMPKTAEAASNIKSKLTSAIDAVKSKMDSMKAVSSKTSVEQPKSNDVDISTKMGKIGAIVRNTGKLMKNAFIEAQIAIKNAKEETNGLSRAFLKIKGAKDSAINGIKKGFSAVSSGVKGVIQRIGSFGKDISGTFTSGMKSVRRFALSLLSIRTAFSGISKAAQAYLAYDQQLSDSIQNSWNALGSLLAPILERVVSLFATLVGYINAVITALTGVNLVARANTKALNGQAKAAGAAAKETKQLAGIDDIDMLTSDSGGGGGGGDSLKPIEVPELSMDNLLDKIFNYDWYKLGVDIGQKINDALSKIDWSFIQSLAVAIATDLSDFLNGLVDGIDWNLIGTTLGNGIQTALLFAYTFMTNFNWQKFGTAIATSLNGVMNTVDFTLLGQTLASKWVALIDWLYGFVTTFDWSKFGKSISETIMGWWNSIDWAKAAETISTGIRGLLTSVKQLIAGIDWQQLGRDVWTFLSTIDWGGIIADLAYIIGQAIAGIVQFLWGFIEDGVKKIGKYFADKIQECGGDIIGGLFKGILDAVQGLNDWMYDNIIKPFIDGFCDMFGIHSPSTVMAELGGYIIEGLKEGLKGAWQAVKQIFIDLKDNIALKFQEITEKIREKFNIQNIKKHCEDVISAIKNVFKAIPDWFKNTFSNAWEKVKNVFSSGGKVFDGIKDGIESTFKTIVNRLIDGINRIIAKPFNKINEMFRTLRNISVMGISPFKNLGSLSVPQIPKLKTGNVATEPLIAQFGEYPGAKQNPEITSPVNLMKDSFRAVLSEFDFNSGTSFEKLCINVAGKNFYDDAIDYINDKTERNGVSVIKEA